MKANRKFLNGDEEAVSPVIAVILMVAITVVLAATVYVWVSGFGSNSSQPAKSIAMTSGGAITDPDGTDHGYLKEFTVASATPGLKWTDITFKLNGAEMTYNAASDDATTEADDDDYCVLTSAGACAATATAAGLVQAGQTFRMEDTADLSGQEFLVLDAASNSIILTLTVS